MPGVEDWINNPLAILQNIFDKYGVVDKQKVTEYFSEKLQNDSAKLWIPSLNHAPIHSLPTNSLVRYRCMVQDMFDPEFYLGAYEVFDNVSNQSSMKSGKYKDIAECSKHQEIKTESKKNVTMDRQTLYCIPIPGETSWVKEGYADMCGKKVYASTSKAPVRCKRGPDDNLDEQSNIQNDTQNVAMETSDGGSIEVTNKSREEVKRTKTDSKTASTSPPNPDLNFPLPGETGISCLVKIYDEIEGFAVNDVLEIVGVLSVDPSLAEFPKEKESSDGIQTSIEDYEEPVEERNAHAPPPSLVPRLHAILCNKLGHNNPLISDTSTVLEQLKVEIDSLRRQIMMTLEHVVFGDTLAAEYLLCYLISSVYGRADVMPLGKFCLNLTQCPSATEYSKLLNTFISAVVTKSHLLPLTVENMNTLRLCPEKDYTANRLKSGLLQLSEDTSLIIDETQLKPGQLEALGVKNMTALGNMISWQKVEYDFSYHRQDFLSNTAVLILSEAKSILPSDCLIPLVPKMLPGDLREHFSSLDSSCTQDFLNKFRSYITVARSIKYSVSESMQQIIQDDFVEIRKHDPKNMTVDDFHTLLNLLRLLSLSHLEVVPLDVLWRKSKSLETQRKQRIQVASSRS